MKEDIENVKVSAIIIPKKAIYKNKLYTIKNIPEKYIIYDYEILLVCNKISNIKISSQHPNADPDGNFCVPDTILTKQLTEDNKKIIHSMLECFNLDSSYFTPYDIILSEKEYKNGF